MNIRKRSELTFFVGLFKLENLEINEQDEIDFSIIDRIIDTKKLIKLSFWNIYKVDKFLTLFENLRSLELKNVKILFD